MKFKNRKNKLKILSIFGILSASIIITTPILLNKNPTLVNSINQANYTNNHDDQNIYNNFEINANTNYSLFSEVFPNDKGFGADWLNAAGDDVQVNDQVFIDKKKSELQTYLNNNKNKVLKNPTNNMTILVEGFLTPSTSTWYPIWKVNETVDGTVNTLTPDPTLIEIDFKPFSNTLPVITNLSNYISNQIKALSPQEASTLTINQVKQWIADYFNQNRSELANGFFPTSGTFTLNDLSSYDNKINITQTGVSIGEASVGYGQWTTLTIPAINEITFTQPSDNTNNKPVDKNYDGDNWQPYVIFGTSGVFLLILAILIIFYIRKRSKNKKAAVAD